MIALKSGYRKYFKNTLWLFLTYGLRLFTGFFVGLWLARYLGPEQYGIYNYVISLTTIFITVAMFGTTEVLIKKILEAADNTLEILKSGFKLRLALAFLLYVLLGIYAYLFESNERIQVYILISAFALFFQPFEVVDSFFRARVQAQKSSVGRMAQLLISAIAKIVLILYGSPLEWFYYIFVFDALFYSFLLMASYLKDNENFLAKSISVISKKEIIKDSFPLMVIALTSLMLSRFDLVLIGKLLGQTEVGYYSAASKTIEIGTLFAVIISSSLYPAILNSKKTDHALYMERMGMLNRMLVWGGILLSVLVYFFSKDLILILFGAKYAPSVEAIQILSLNLTFISFYQVSFRWYLSENLQILMMFKTLGAVVFNILLNLQLIPRYGISGAAIGSLVTSFLFHFLFEAFSKKTRECFRINTSFLRLP